MKCIRFARVLTAAIATMAAHGAAGAQENGGAAPAVVCASRIGERQTCEADTKAGVTLLKSIGPIACERGKTWGFDQRSIWVSDGCSGEFDVGARTRNGSYSPESGFELADTDQGDVNLRVYTYLRYLNQLGLDDTYTDAFGVTKPIDVRQDIQFQKVDIQLNGWLLSERFRYLAYVWTSNVSQGLSASVVVNGRLTYRVNDHFMLGGGTAALPGVRALEGNHPHWLTVDNRLLADEFFRPSFTTGLWVNGKILHGITYHVMVGNNMSQLGVDAGQLNAVLGTWSGALTWAPTTGEFGAGFGDFEQHEKLATRIGVHFTRSDENAQGAANADGFENVLIRLSDGSPVFTPDLFGSGISVTDATYQMGSVDAGLKYRGFSLEGEHYWRQVDHFRGTGTDGLDDLWDHGFQLQASGMVIQKRMQLYVSSSKVYGRYGNPSEFRVGVNWFPFKNRLVRWNNEYLNLNRSPVGGLSLPSLVGGNGSVFYSTFEVDF